MADPPVAARQELADVTSSPLVAGRGPSGSHLKVADSSHAGGADGGGTAPATLMLSRTVRVLDATATPQPPGGNRVTTTRFTWWNFVFLFLFEQFDPRHKFANFYFLIICVLQSLDAISITNGYPVCLNALGFVVLVQFVLTLKETISRCSNDRATNSRPIEVVADSGTGALEPRSWGDVRIGDVVKVTRGSFFPADLILIATPAPTEAGTEAGAGDADDGGACFINTQNLDGETNHKIRKVPHLPAAAAASASASRPRRVSGSGGLVGGGGMAESAAAAALAAGWDGAEVRCEAFNSRTTEFTATVHFGAGRAAAMPLSIDNLLLRGCVLVDCEWVLGVAVAVGSKSKCFFREGVDDDGSSGDAGAGAGGLRGCCKAATGKSKKKASDDGMKVASVHAFINRQIGWFIAILVAMCLFGTLYWYADLVRTSRQGAHFWYLGPDYVADGLHAAAPARDNDTLLQDDEASDNDKIGNGDGDGLPSFEEVVKQFFRFFLLNYQLVPVSLYVSLNLISMCQQFFMVRDAQMFSAADGGQRCRVSSMELNDELGLVTHLLTDKTGTLTQNSMRLCGLFAYGRLYGSNAAGSDGGFDDGRGEGRSGSGGGSDGSRRGGGEGRGPPLQSKFLNFVDGARHSASADLVDGGGGDGGGGAGGRVAVCLRHGTTAAFRAAGGADAIAAVSRTAALRLLGINMAVNHSLQVQPATAGKGGRDGHGGDTEGKEEGVEEEDEEEEAAAAEASGCIAAMERDLVGVSQDEKAFVVAAAAVLGVRFSHRDQAADTVTLEIDYVKVDAATGERTTRRRPLELRVVETFDYTTARKRMGCIVEDAGGDAGELARLTGGASRVVFVKGADTVLKELLLSTPDAGAGGALPNAAASVGALDAQLQSWGERCFRSLVFAFKPLGAHGLTAWAEQYRAARTDDAALAARAAGAVDNPIDALVAEMESGLFLQGATACEDELQRNVPQTIAALRRAGIRVWMLTGDRVDTACNIAEACGLLGGDGGGNAPATVSARRTHVASGGGGGDDDAAAELVRLQMEGEGDRGGAQRRLVFLTADAAETLAAEAVDVGVAGGARRRGRPLRDVAAVELAAAGAVFDAAAAAAGGDVDATEARVADDAAASCSGCGALAALRQALRAAADAPAWATALVVDEKAADYLLASHALRATFVQAAQSCATVLACRIRKEQKAKLVKALREYRSSGRQQQPCARRCFGGCVCCDHAGGRPRGDLDADPVNAICAIGDGANDVAMIRAADVGIGVVGKEGREAANSADFGLARFDFLQQLLLVHGRYNAYRTAKVVPFIFYKNLANVLTQFLFQFWARMSGQILWPVAGTSWYNTIFTAFAILYLGIFDRDVPRAYAVRHPELFRRGPGNRFLSCGVFWAWQADALWATALLLGVPALVLEPAMGHSIRFWDFSVFVFSMLIALVQLKVTLEVTQFHFIYDLMWWLLGLPLWLAYATYLSYYPTQDTPIANAVPNLAGSRVAWLAALLVLVLYLTRALGWKALRREFCPSLYHRVQEQAVLDRAAAKPKRD